jgi:hypothetical protein
MVLRVTYDVNVWVAHFLSLSKGRQGTAAQRVIRSAFAGHCRLGSVQPIISHTMLDTMQGVLIRRGLTEVAAEAARNAVESSAADGVVPQPPYMLLGGGVQPMNDSNEDHSCCLPCLVEFSVPSARGFARRTQLLFSFLGGLSRS